MSLYSNVYEKDYLGFFANQVLNPRHVAEFLELERDDVARMTGISKSSVRWDNKIPPIILKRFQVIANICLLVADHFDGDPRKTALWFRTPNPMLGNVTPRDMVRFGRDDKLLKFVMSEREGEPIGPPPSKG